MSPLQFRPFEKFIICSPKDACYDLENATVLAHLKQRLEQFYASAQGAELLSTVLQAKPAEQEEAARQLSNEEVKLFFESANEGMRVTKAKEAMEVCMTVAIILSFGPSQSHAQPAVLHLRSNFV